MKKKVTIITVTYNSAKYLERCMKSVFSQSYPNIEYIIIDGASTDETVSIIKKYKEKITYWVSEPDGGIYDAMNKGIAKASGGILYFLNSDDYFYDNQVVEDIVEEFRREPEVGLIYGNVIKVIEEHDIKFKFRCSVNFLNLTKPLLLPQQAFFYKKRIFDKLGNFDISYQGSGDYEYLCRMYVNDISMKEIDRTIVYSKKGGVSTYVAEGHRALKKYFGRKYAIRTFVVSKIKLSLRFLMRKLRLDKCVYKILYGNRDI